MPIYHAIPHHCHIDPITRLQRKPRRFHHCAAQYAPRRPLACHHSLRSGLRQVDLRPQWCHHIYSGLLYAGVRPHAGFIPSSRNNPTISRADDCTESKYTAYYNYPQYRPTGIADIFFPYRRCSPSHPQPCRGQQAAGHHPLWVVPWLQCWQGVCPCAIYIIRWAPTPSTWRECGPGRCL